MLAHQADYIGLVPEACPSLHGEPDRTRPRSWTKCEVEDWRRSSVGRGGRARNEHQQDDPCSPDSTVASHSLLPLEGVCPQRVPR
jgi:hypothetical protein